MKDKLLDSLINNTISGQLQWKLIPSIFNSETEFHYSCLLNDGTEIKIEIDLDKENLKFSRCNHIKVINKNLVNGELYISDYGNSKVASVGQIVYDKYIKPNIVPKPKTQDQVLLDIIDAIPSKQELRDMKITEIVGIESKETMPIEPKPIDIVEPTPVVEEKNTQPKFKLNKIIDILFGG